MNGATWISLFLIYFVIFYTAYKKKKFIKNRQKNKGKGIKEMEEVIKKYMNKPVVLSLIDDSFDNEGEIISYSDGWIVFKTKKGQEHAINCDFIIKIREKKTKSK